MKSNVWVFLAGTLIGALVLATALLVPRYVAFQRSEIPHWSRQEVIQKGFADFRNTKPIVARWDIGPVAETCLSDFHSMADGRAQLGLVYESSDGKFLVLMFSADRDKWGRYVTDRVITYVYDTQTKKLFGKFWAPMA